MIKILTTYHLGKIACLTNYLNCCNLGLKKKEKNKLVINNVNLKMIHMNRNVFWKAKS